MASIEVIRVTSQFFFVGDGHPMLYKSSVASYRRITLNPRTDGSLGHLSIDGGADNRPHPGDIENEAR